MIHLLLVKPLTLHHQHLSTLSTMVTFCTFLAFSICICPSFWSSRLNRRKMLAKWASSITFSFFNPTFLDINYCFRSCSNRSVKIPRARISSECAIFSSFLTSTSNSNRYFTFFHRFKHLFSHLSSSLLFSRYRPWSWSFWAGFHQNNISECTTGLLLLSRHWSLSWWSWTASVIMMHTMDLCPGITISKQQIIFLAHVSKLNISLFQSLLYVASWWLTHWWRQTTFLWRALHRSCWTFSFSFSMNNIRNLIFLSSVDFFGLIFWFKPSSTHSI